MATILGVGIATLDIINSVEHYPREDAEVRASAQALRRGGNATNTLVVLSQLGHHCAWAGTLADDSNSELIRADLTSYQVDMSAVQVICGGRVPTSYITLSRQNGSRTIVHYRELPELSAADFCRIELSAFDWLHFEGRNVSETHAMLVYARDNAPGLPRSLEVEKPRDGIECLLPLAQHLLYSRDYAQSQGFGSDAAAFLGKMAREFPAAQHVCTWGEQGAYGLAAQQDTPPEAEIIHSPAVAPATVVDTLGAGDTFNAGYIDACLRGQELASALQAACRLAGRKCGQPGLGGLV